LGIVRAFTGGSKDVRFITWVGETLLGDYKNPLRDETGGYIVSPPFLRRSG